MNPQAFSSVSLFLDSGAPVSAIKKVLSRYGAQDVKINGDNVAFELDGASYENVQELFNELLDHLCATRRSQATVFEDDDVHCLTARNGQVLAH